MAGRASYFSYPPSPPSEAVFLDEVDEGGLAEDICELSPPSNPGGSLDEMGRGAWMRHLFWPGEGAGFFDSWMRWMRRGLDEETCDSNPPSNPGGSLDETGRVWMRHLFWPGAGDPVDFCRCQGRDTT